MTTPEQQAEFGRMIAALSVVVLDCGIRQHMLRHDPKAFEQAYGAVQKYLTVDQRKLVMVDKLRIETEDNFCTGCEQIIDKPEDHAEGCWEITPCEN